MPRKLNDNEKKWIYKLLEARFVDRDIIFRQIKNAKVQDNYNKGFYSLRFTVNKKIAPFPHTQRVPVQMNANQKDGHPIVFILHVIDGYVNELKIYNAAGYEMTYKFSIDDVEYIIEPELQV